MQLVLPHRHLLRVRYLECDAQRVVFNGRYGDYVDVAFTEFLRSLRNPAIGLDREPELQLVRQTTQWKAPSRYDDVLELRVGVIHIGNTSFTTRTEFRGYADGELRAESETVYVHVDPRTLGKQPIPNDLRAALGNTSPRVSNHAGV